MKESELVLSQRGVISSLPRKKSSLDKVSKGKMRSSREANDNLPTTLIPNKSGLHFQLNPDSMPTSIVELLNNHVFGKFPNLTEPWMVSKIFHIVQFTEQSASFAAKIEGDLFGASKRQVLLISFFLLFFLPCNFLVIF